LGFKEIICSPFVLPDDEIKKYTRPWGSSIAPLPRWACLLNGEYSGLILSENWRAQNCNSRHSLNLHNGVFRFEVRSGDRWVEEQGDVSDGRERSEVYGFSEENGSVVANDLWMSFSMLIEKGAANRSLSSLYCSLMQIHSAPNESDPLDVSPPIMLDYLGDRLRLRTLHSSQSPVITNPSPQVDRYTMPDVPRGVWINFVFRTRFSQTSAGQLQLWVNGTSTVNLSGINIGYVGRSAYPKFGIYRNNGLSQQPLAVRFCNMEFGIANLTGRILTPLAIPDTF
jgi:hypothetical protein